METLLPDAPPAAALSVVAEHPDFWVLAKPAGLSFHGEQGEAGCVMLARDITGETALHPVHRLDRMTSGLLLLARHAEAARQLGALFAAGAVEKTYLALSDCPPGKKQGWIKGGMVKGRQGSWRLTRDTGPQAITRFVSQGLLGEGLPAGLRLFAVFPQTGRTHQIRVALKSLGSPILGDRRYGGSMADRGYLHAFCLRFDWQGGRQEFTLLPDTGVYYRHPVCLQGIEALCVKQLCG